MATVSRFYSGKSDANLNKDGMLKSPDIMISKWEFIGKGVLTIATTNAEIVLTTSETIADDQFNSTGLKNLLITDDNGKVCRVKIDDTTGTTKKVIAVLADIKTEESDVAGSFTTGHTYDVAILTPAQSSAEYGGVYGSFFGFGKLSVSHSVKKAELRYGVPAKLVWQDIVEKGLKLSGETSMVTNGDTLEAILNVVLYGLQTGQVSYGVASNPGSMPFYRIVLVGKDINNQTGIDVFHKIQFTPNGAIDKFGAEYKKIQFEAECFSFGMYPDNKSDLAMSVRLA
jgi:hypothetical protein